MDPIEFTLPDADGVAHRYVLLPHGATEGQRIVFQLVALGAEPLARLAQGLLTIEGVSLKRLLNDPAALKTLGEKLDVAALGGDIKRSIASMPDQLTAALVSRCTRDGKQLSNPSHFDTAFARNYGELARLLWEVIRVNRFLSLFATTPSARP